MPEAENTNHLAVEVSDKVWDMIMACLGSGLYGEKLDDVVLGLMRPGFAEAIRIGIVKL